MFTVKSYREYIMTDGDNVAYEQLMGDVQALQRIVSKRPEKAAALRRILKVKTQQIAAMEARYA